MLENTAPVCSNYCILLQARHPVIKVKKEGLQKTELKNLKSLQCNSTSVDCLKWNCFGFEVCFCSLCAAGCLVFEDFLRTEYSEENLLFWLACEKYKTIASKTEMMGAAKKIYTDFVQVDAPRQV